MQRTFLYRSHVDWRENVCFKVFSFTIKLLCAKLAVLFTKLISIFVLIFIIHAVVIICVCQIFITETACLLVM